MGENPATADAAGINVNASKYTATCIGGVIAGLGGLYYVMDYSIGIWSNNGFGDRGWLAIAIVIFAIWQPDSVHFRLLSFRRTLYFVLLYTRPMTYIPTIQMLPYVVTIIDLTL